jgi:hypothetical protein
MKKNAEEVVRKILFSVDRNHLIHDSSHLGVDVNTKGFLFWKKTEIRVAGRVDNEKEKAEIDKILDAESDGIPIVNNLRVERR